MWSCGEFAWGFRLFVWGFLQANRPSSSKMSGSRCHLAYVVQLQPHINVCTRHLTRTFKKANADLKKENKLNFNACRLFSLFHLRKISYGCYITGKLYKLKSRLPWTTIKIHTSPKEVRQTLCNNWFESKISNSCVLNHFGKYLERTQWWQIIETRQTNVPFNNIACFSIDLYAHGDISRYNRA